jgi:hypothetical protein
MPLAGFETETPANERPPIQALDRAATEMRQNAIRQFKNISPITDINSSYTAF